MVSAAGEEAARRLVGLYEDGVLTEREFVMETLVAASQYDPEEIARELPAELLEMVREETRSPPADASGVSPVWGGGLTEEQIMTRRENARDGAWFWFQYFQR